MRRIKKKAIIIFMIVILFLAFVIAVGFHFFFYTKKDKPIYAFESNMETIVSGKYDESFRYISLEGTIIDSLSNGNLSSIIM